MKTAEQIQARIDVLEQLNTANRETADIHAKTPYAQQTQEQREWDGDMAVLQHRLNQSQINGLKWVLEQ
jgi:hypothetical protein